MGFLDSLAKSGNLGSIGEMISDNPDLVKAAGSLLNSEDGSVGGSGGLNDVLAQLSAGGLGDQVSSWLSSGENKSVTADQISSALNSDALKQYAEKAGIDMSQVGTALAAVLPGLVDQLTPDGKAPSGDALSGLLGSLTR